MTSFSTSGTTGKPKTFVMTEAQMQSRVLTMDDTTRGTGFSACRSIFVDLHPTSAIGARYIEYGKLHGVDIIFPFHGTTEETIDFLIAHKIEGIASTPSGMLNYATVSAGRYKPSWMIVSTASLSADRSRAIRAGLSDNLWSSYACSEIGTISIASAEQIETLPGCVGKVVPQVIVAFDNNEIIIKATTAISGYDDPDLTASKFRGGWYYTGDLGHKKDGLLYFDGRKQ